MTEFIVMTDGLAFPEGPIACDDGSVIVCEVRSGDITRVKPDGSKQTIATIDGAPNGLAIGPDGAIYCCNNGGFSWEDGLDLPTGTATDYRTGSIERIDIATGKVERLYDSCDGIQLAGPNDLVFDAQGNIWFTDLGKERHGCELHGGLYYAACDGSSITRVATGQGLNGVGLSPDGKTVYAAASFLRWIVAFDTNPNVAKPVSILGEAEIVAEYTGRRFLDSLAMEADGTIAQAIVLERPGISRVMPGSGKEETIPFPDILPTNIAFGGDDMCTAYVTLTTTGQLAKLRWPAPGMRLPFNC